MTGQHLKSECTLQQTVTLLLFLGCKKNDKFCCTSMVYSGKGSSIIQ